MATTAYDPRRIFSTDSAKAIKASKYGYLNAIHYMAPADTAGVGNLCPNAGVCTMLCLGQYSGQAAMVADLENGDNSVRRSRRAKARAFMQNREAYMLDLERGIARERVRAKRLGLTLCVRLNGSTDIVWERVRYGKQRRTLLEVFGDVQFVDYTKNPRRLGRTPSNLHLTFSRDSAANEADCLAALAAGHNVAIVFAGGLPATWNGFTVIDGDKHDLRHLDPRGVVVGLTPKGAKAKRDQSGFVVRDYVDAAPMALAA